MNITSSGERHLIGRIKIKPEYYAEAAKFLFEVMMTSRKEPGNIYYYITADLEDPNIFNFHDGWESAEDLERHFSHERVERTLAALQPMLDGEIIVYTGEPIAGS
jgi:quinol monooxygenase YgiN